MAEKAPAKATTDTTVTAPSPAQMMLRKMAGMVTDNKTSIEDLNAILNATDEEFWDSDERASINAKTLSGCVIEISGFEVRYGEGAIGDEDIVTPFIDPRNGRQMYLMVTSTIIDKRAQNKLYVLPKEHEEFQWNTSARYIVAKLMSASNRGWFDAGKPPLRVRIIGTAIGGKRQVEKLKSADAPYVVSTVATGPNGSSDAPPPDEPPF
jgi:hypothetical protein